MDKPKESEQPNDVKKEERTAERKPRLSSTRQKNDIKEEHNKSKDKKSYSSTRKESRTISEKKDSTKHKSSSGKDEKDKNYSENTRRSSRSPFHGASTGSFPRGSRGVVPRGSRNTFHRNSRSPLRKSPIRKPNSPFCRRSRSPLQRRSRSPLQQRSRSPLQQRSRSPLQQRSRSPLQQRSRSPFHARTRNQFPRSSRSPLSRRSRSPFHRDSRSPAFNRRCKSPLRRRSVSPFDERNIRSALEIVRRNSRSPIGRETCRSPRQKRRRSHSRERHSLLYYDDARENFNVSQMSEHENAHFSSKQSPEYEDSDECDTSAPISQLEVEYFSGDASQSAGSWLLRIDEFGDMKRWDDKTKTFHMTSKLAGYAQTWYIGLENNDLSWTAWKEKLVRAFPSDQDFDVQLIQMLERRKKPEESFDKYFCHKVAMLNSCNISKRRAVACILGGIDDVQLVRQARSGNFDSVEKLYEFLCRWRSAPSVPVSALMVPSFVAVPQNAGHPSVAQRGCNKCGMQNHETNECQVRALMQPPKPKVPFCWICKVEGHITSDCPNSKNYKKSAAVPGAEASQDHSTKKRRRYKPHAVKKAAYLEKIAELAKPPPPKEPQPDEISHVSIMYGVFRNIRCLKKYFIDVCINGTIFEGYVDAKCEHVTIRHEAVEKLGLAVRKDYRMIQGVGFCTISTHGSVEVMLRADLAVGKVVAFVIPDHIQKIAVIVGRSFLEMPNVELVDGASKISIRQSLRSVQQAWHNIQANVNPVITAQPVNYGVNPY